MVRGLGAGLKRNAQRPPIGVENDRVLTVGAPADGVVLDLGRPRSLGGVAFELSDAPWLERPGVSVSVDGRQWGGIPARASLAEATLALYRDPRHGQGTVRFAPVIARFVRLDPGLPARPGVLEAAASR